MTEQKSGLIEVVRIRPNEGEREAILQLRPRFCAEFREKTAGFIANSFHEMEDGTFLDIVLWTNAAALEAVDEDHPLLEEWYGKVEILTMETGTPINA